MASPVTSSNTVTNTKYVCDHQPGIQSVAENTIAVQPLVQQIPGFDDYFLGLRRSNNKRNIWFKEYARSVYTVTSFVFDGSKFVGSVD